VRFPESWSSTSLAKKRCLGTAQDKFALDRAFSLIEGHPAAHRAGLFEVILPQENEKDVAEVPENLRTAMKLHFVDNMDQVLAVALEGPLPQIQPERETMAPIATPPAGESSTTHQ
jgi:hypothetical protein